MPAEQSGGATKIGKAWRASWYDEDGKRRTKSGFATKTAAKAYALEKADRVRKIRSGDLAGDGERPRTVGELIDVFLEKHGSRVDPGTTRKLAYHLKAVRETFGGRRPDDLRRVELEDWRDQLKPGTRHDTFRSFRQTLSWGLKRGLLEHNATDAIANPKPKQHERRDVHPFEDWAELEKVVAELDVRYQAIPIFAAATGMRPEEWIGLHRADIDRQARVAHVRRRFTGGLEKPGTKTGGERVVPLTQRALAALDMLPHRIDTPILFPAPRGGYLDLEKWRWREWTPALRAAGVPHRRVNDLRHTFATWAIMAGVPTLTLGQVMGTSTAQLEDTYVRWLKSTADRVRTILDTADAAAG